jgi:2-oxoisovalerate dehydrogenase E1 component alpha subunit
MGQLYSNDLDPLQGRQLPILHSARDYGFFSDLGQSGHAICAGGGLGDGLRACAATARSPRAGSATAPPRPNDFHSALLSASVYLPPVVLNVVNNQWAISTYTGVAVGKQRDLCRPRPRLRHPGLAGRRQRLPGRRGGVALGRRTGRGAGQGPVLIEWFTYRAAAHSTSDDPERLSATKDEALAWPLGDPVDRLKAASDRCAANGPRNAHMSRPRPRSSTR